ncbi:unnamed protein product [Absidia cylindrospora]
MVSAALYERLNNVTTSLDDKENHLKRTYDRINSLKSRNRRLVAENEDIRERLAPPISDRITHSKKRARPFRADAFLSATRQDKQPAIQVDSGDDTEDPDDMFWIPPANTNVKKNSQMTTHGDENTQSSSSRNSSIDGQQSRERVSEVDKRQARRKKLKRMGIWGNGILPPVLMNSNTHGSDNNSNTNNDSEDENEDQAFSDNFPSDDDDRYDSASSPLPPLRIVSPVRKITLSQMALLSRVIELSSDEENENYA